VTENRWTAVDHYLRERLVPADPTLDRCLEANAAAGLPAHEVSSLQGQFLYLVARMIGARRILEIGTLGGYSTIWLAKAVADGGRVVTVEADSRHAEVARANIGAAGLSDRIDLRVGEALTVLPEIADGAGGPFDMVFIDADKSNNARYLDWTMRLARPGTVIVADNVVRNGAVVNPHNSDPSVQGIRRFFDALAADRRLCATALQTVGEKGWDGFAMAVVL
jgi:predicted O-methyltransferase YrrM